MNGACRSRLNDGHLEVHAVEAGKMPAPVKAVLVRDWDQFANTAALTDEGRLPA